MNITIKDLRRLLTDVDNQELTVRELRTILFDEENEDFELNNITSRKLTQITKK